MNPNPHPLDSLLARLAPVHDRQLASEAGSATASSLFERIVSTRVATRETPRRSIGRRRLLQIALAVALVLAVVASVPALGVGREIASFFAGWHDPDAPVPTAPDVVIASGEAGVPWRIVATTSDQGLCLALVYPIEGVEGGSGGCHYRDIRGELPPEVRGNPATKCLATPTTTVPCGSLPLHWIGLLGAGGGGSSLLTRTFAYGPLAADVASVELLLTNGETVHAHVVERPEGLDAPLNFYWAAWPCGSRGCVDETGPDVEIAIARDSAGRVLERRVPAWNGNPTGDPNGAPPPAEAD